MTKEIGPGRDPVKQYLIYENGVNAGLLKPESVKKVRSRQFELAKAMSQDDMSRMEQVRRELQQQHERGRNNH